MDLDYECQQMATRAIHADKHVQGQLPDVAPAIRMSTTFSYPPDISHETIDSYDRQGVVYQRSSHPNALRAEAILSSIIAKPTLIFGSGLAAFHTALVVLNAKNIYTATPSYRGSHQVLQLLQKTQGLLVHDIDELDHLQSGDVIHLESPVNPTGHCRDISHYAEIAHSKGAILLVDSTFAPPPLSNPFKHGADIVLHSATKYFGGHSDVLGGTLSFNDPQHYAQAVHDRSLLGSICAPWESWLLLRSLKTFPLRIKAQIQNTLRVVQYLASHKPTGIDRISHATLQTDPWVEKQLPFGSPTILVTCATAQVAKALVSNVKLFFHCTSLGGVESTLEWWHLSEPSACSKLVRMSIGVENADDLIADILQALTAIGPE